MNATETISVSLVTQGKHKFYTGTMPIDILANICVVDSRDENPMDGFQRHLDEKRALEIAEYIDSGVGSIPTSIILSAQPSAQLKYTSRNRSIAFKTAPNAFLILDGQHRVYGFTKAKTKSRIPVVIYKDLTRQEESRLFIDINTKQRPVPNELLLDIKALANTEGSKEEQLRNLFDRFAKEPDSPLIGLLSAASKAKGKLSRVTFNAAGKYILPTVGDAEPDRVYEIISAYLWSWTNELEKRKLGNMITSPTLFRAMFMLFPVIALRVSDRTGKFTVDEFSRVLAPMFSKLANSKLSSPGNSANALVSICKNLLERQFTIA